MLTLAVLSILVTAPIGAIVIALKGPVWLTKDEDDEEEGAASAAKPLSMPSLVDSK